jgi:hypothetical protein
LNLNAGRSVSLVGVGSVGKSNFLRNLLNMEVVKAYLGPDSEGLHFVLIDPNNMLDAYPTPAANSRPSSWAGYEIMTHRLYRHFQPQFATMPEQVGRDLFQVYQNLQDGANPLTPYVALRNFEYAVDLIIRQGHRLVFLFDEFDVMLRELPTKFFRTLRGLRDDYKYQLAYLTMTRKTMPDLITEASYDYDELESFIELFSDTTRFIAAYGMRDALDVLHSIMDRQQVQLTPSVQDMIIKLSGGHAGLLRAAFSVAYDLIDGSIEENAARLARYSAVQAEAHTIWLSLNTAEKDCLLYVMTRKLDGVDARSPEVRTLTDKQLMQQVNGVPAVTPPLFQAYLQSQVKNRQG